MSSIRSQKSNFSPGRRAVEVSSLERAAGLNLDASVDITMRAYNAQEKMEGPSRITWGTISSELKKVEAAYSSPDRVKKAWGAIGNTPQEIYKKAKMSILHEEEEVDFTPYSQIKLMDDNRTNVVELKDELMIDA